MRRVLVALFAVFRELNLALYELLVLAGIVVGALTNDAAQLDEVFTEFRVGHGFEMGIKTMGIVYLIPRLFATIRLPAVRSPIEYDIRFVIAHASLKLRS